MEHQPRISSPSTVQEPISIKGAYPAAHRSFAGFLICLALLVAVFGVSCFFKNAEIVNLFRPTGGAGDAVRETQASLLENESTVGSEGLPIPITGTPVVSMDLSYLSLGKHYIHNETPYTPSVDALLSRDIGFHTLSSGVPTVLVLHTHTSEAYLTEEKASIGGELGRETYSREAQRNVLAVGSAFCQVLKEKGITAIHCTVMLDSPTLQGSYERSAEIIREYLEKYPEITYVIDLHRDALTDREGGYIRTLATGATEPTAQVMAVVGTDCNGTPCPDWMENLALALQLREKLNQNGESLCRPISLRNASYNQELAPRQLLLEIGSGGNTVEEAIRAAQRTAECLAEILLDQ